MLNKIRRAFNKKEEERRMNIKEDPADKSRELKNVTLAGWMESAGEDGENSDEEVEFTVSDLSKTEVEEKAHPHLEMIVNESGLRGVSDRVVPAILESVPAENTNADVVDIKEKELSLRLQQAEAQVTAAMAEIAAVRKEWSAYQSARDRVRKVA